MAARRRGTDPERREIGGFDYVIVGAGTAGCVLANRLSADPAVSVLLLEAGGKDSYPWIHIPVGYLYTQNNPRTDWCFKTEAEAGLGGRVLNYPRGKVLGGCSSINGMIYMRGQAADYDQWRQLGNRGWGWDDVLPYFRKSEDYVHGADEMHGAGGEWRVEEMRLSWEILDAFRDAAAEVGIPADRRLQPGQQRGLRLFPGQPEARRALEHGQGVPPAGARAAEPRGPDRRRGDPDRVRWRPRRGPALPSATAGMPTPSVRGELILAAGAIGSPQLLQLSGVGPGEPLQAAGIEPVHALEGVGANLQDHLQLRLIYKVQGTRTLNEQASRLLARGWMGVEYFLFRRGPLTMAPSQLGAFARSDPARATPNLQYHIQPLSLDKFGEPLHPFPAFTASVCNLRPESRGEVRITSPRPGVPPAIRPNYLATEADRMVAADAIRLTRRICAAESTRPVPAGRAQAGGRVPERSGARRRRRARSARPSFIRSGPAGWARIPAPWSTTGCVCTALRACGWSMPRSCRPSRRATPTPR